MRIREIEFHNFRSFRGRRLISFVDPLTDTVRPVTVLAGSNGSGKTTVLEAIEALLHYILEPGQISPLVYEALQDGFVRLAVEFVRQDIPPGSSGKDVFTDDAPRVLHIAVGVKELAGDAITKLRPNLFARFRDTSKIGFDSSFVKALREAVEAMEVRQADPHGGLLYFPYDRRLDVVGSAAIEQPKETRQWLFRLAAKDKWQGSLQQLWAWQDYRDLADFRQRVEGAGTQSQAGPERPNLGPFVSSVESVLGQGRTVVVRDGHPYVSVSWAPGGEETRVRLDQLPSGEQQILLLFGELARRRRSGAVIMIDEVENSLHPTLQRLVMWNLSRLTREWNAQAIVATHSLEVINTVRGGAFINLDYPEDRFNLPAPLDSEEMSQ